jgi:hypothetical protein
MQTSFLNPKELKYINDVDFLITKHTIISKIFNELKEVEKSLIEKIKNYHSAEIQILAKKRGKISKGENYRLLPYLVLDFPRNYTKDSGLSYRAMFWWGNCLSATLHIQGDYLNKYRLALQQNLPKLKEEHELYFCVNDTPWEYHYNQDNYLPINNCTDDDINDQITHRSFLKISYKHSLEFPSDFKDFFLNSFDKLISLLESDENPYGINYH